MSSTTANHGDAVRALSSVFITAQSDTRNTDRRMPVKKGKKYLYLNNNIVSLGKMDRKTEPFSY